MGGGTFDQDAYRSFASATASKTREEIYTSRSINKNLDPKGVAIRESRDSTDSPQATPVIVALDVTGSMGMLAEVIAKQGLGTLFTSILDRKPISNPHVMFMGIGDANCDSAPLQVSQFEADNRIVEQLTQLWLEGGGGGNNFESYNLPWYFAAFHTAHDSMEKRGKRGYLFTVGDECAPAPLTKSQLKAILGDDVQSELSTEDLLALAQRSYEIFHVIIAEGSYARDHLDKVKQSWAKLLGQHVIVLQDHKLLSETIVSAIEVAEGADAAGSTAAWGGGKGAIVHDAVKSLPRGNKPRPLLGGPTT